LNSSRIIRRSAPWAINKRRRGAFFLFFLAVFVQVAARERAAEGLDDEQKQNDFSWIHGAPHCGGLRIAESWKRPLFLFL
jgi:deferrochelatase/peroxidase EfeB